MAATRSEVAERYAAALFDLSQEDKAVDAIEADMKALGGLLAESEPLQRLVSSPVFDADVKEQGINAILAKAEAQEITKNLCALMARNRRLSELGAVITAFLARAAEARGEIAAEAIAAQDLTEEQTDKLRAEIEKSVGKAVNLTTRVDKGLLGGLIVKIGSTMVDSSIRTKLNRLQQSLKEA